MNGFETYLDIIINQVRQLAAEDDIFNDSEFREIFKNHIFGLRGPKQLAKKREKGDRNILKLLEGFFEIANSYYCLIDIETYIGRFPYGNTEIYKTRHLEYHMENYLNEAYILKERLNAYSTLIQRLYKKNFNGSRFIER